MKRRNFLKFLGVGATAPVAAKILAKPEALVEVEDDIKVLVADAVGVKPGTIITDLDAEPGIIRLSQCLSVSVHHDNDIQSSPVPGGSYQAWRVGRLDVTITLEALYPTEVHDLFQSAAKVVIINDSPRYRGVLPPQVKALPVYSTVDAVEWSNDAVARLEFRVVT